MNWHDILGLSVLGAFVTTVGSLIATVLKDFIFTRSLEKWKSRQQLRQVYLKLRDPLLLATTELVNRIAEITFESSVNFLEARLLQAKPMRMIANSADDEYYQCYKFVSTLYRLCAWLSWVELYRQEVAFLDSGQQKTNTDFEHHIEAIRSSLADGHLNEADDWLRWTDSLIFREEQRAIGESMLDSQRRSVAGYGSFCDKFITPGSGPTNRWITVATNFLSDLKSVSGGTATDFRKARCLLVVKHGVSLIACLNNDRVTPRLLEFREKAEKQLAKMPVKRLALRNG